MRPTFVCSQCGSTVYVDEADIHPFKVWPERHGYARFYSRDSWSDEVPSFETLLPNSCVVKDLPSGTQYFAYIDHFDLYRMLTHLWSLSDASARFLTRMRMKTVEEKREKLRPLFAAWLSITADSEALSVYTLIRGSLTTTRVPSMQTDDEIATRVAKLFDLPKFWTEEFWS